MEKVIITENDSGGVAIGYIASDMLNKLSIYQIAEKDVPEGKPFWIANKEDLPQDHTFFDAWELDLESLGEPDGHGMSYQEWLEENT